MIVHSAKEKSLDFIICDLCKGRIRSKGFGVIIKNCKIISLTREHLMGYRAHLCSDCLISVFKLIKQDLNED